MSHLWVKNAEDQWAVLPLDAEMYVLSTNPPRPMPNADNDIASSVVLVRNTKAGIQSWVLIVGQDRCVRVNGVKLSLGMQVVADRDEIHVVDVGTCFFSTEGLAQTGIFPGAAQSSYCPRCRQEIEKECAAVQCPHCHVWYHETEELPCWTYSESCALCPQTTDFEAGYRWTPEDL